MTKTQRLRMPVDITMTILSIILMGGNYLFPADIVHEILGVGLFVLWAVHITLNRRWYGAIFRGKYNPYRVMQTVINCCILICTIFLMISGIILSNHLFTFLNIQSGLGFARIAHLLASHWYYLFMSLHIGMHVGMIANKIKQKRNDGSKEYGQPQPTAKKIILGVLLALACAYGLYAFIARGVWKYLILQQQFFFFDLERGYILFALDYISIIILFATISHFVARKGKTFFYILLQLTWGFPQTLAGFVYFLLNIRRKHYFFHGSIVTLWKSKSSLSLGAFVFVSDDPFFYYQDYKSQYDEKTFLNMLLVHEYGHTIQSLFFGPLYLFLVGLPSILWSFLPVFVKKREKEEISYFSAYPERWANQLGEWISKEESIGEPV